MPRPSNSSSLLQPPSQVLGRLQWTETVQGKETTTKSGLALIDKSVKDNQYWIRVIDENLDDQRSLLFKIPCDQNSTAINNATSEGTKNFEFLYTYTQGVNSNSTIVEASVEPHGDVDVHLDETTGRTTLSFACAFTDQRSDTHEIKGRCEWPGTSAHSQLVGRFSWKEGNTQYASTEAWLIYGVGPRGPAWILLGEEGEMTSPHFRQWVIYIYSDDENAPILGKTFVHLDEKSNFHYYTGDGHGYEGQYSVTLTLVANPLRCEATFHTTIPPDIVKMTDGKFLAHT